MAYFKTQKEKDDAIKAKKKELADLAEKINPFDGQLVEFSHKLAQATIREGRFEDHCKDIAILHDKIGTILAESKKLTDARKLLRSELAYLESASVAA